MPADEHRRAGILAPKPRLVAPLWTRQRKSKSPWLRRSQSRSTRAGRSALEFQLPPRRLSRHARLRFEEPDRESAKWPLFKERAARATGRAQGTERNSQG